MSAHGRAISRQGSGPFALVSSSCYNLAPESGILGIAALEQKRLEARIYGQVQGVGFRFFARQAARRLNLQGYVRNRQDRSVEVVAEGEKHALEQFLAELKQGPSAATVERVETKWQPNRHTFLGFEVRF